MHHIQTAHGLAVKALYLTAPNPRVGCVLSNAQGCVIGQGHTQRAGSAHAEIMALRDAAAQGHSTLGATAWVTLEPCSHHGRTGPCCDALIAAGIARVVASHTDPNPLVAGQGFARLRAAGVQVHVLTPQDPLAIQSRELNIGFFSRMQRARPWVRMKIAASLDGQTALANGASKWITSEAARRDGHAWRARSCAVLTGIGTILHDNPRLDARLVDTPRQPWVAVADSRLRTPVDAHILIAGRACHIYAASPIEAKKTALEARGASVHLLHGVSGQVDLHALLADLARREVNELHVEAGQELNGALLREGLVDELLVYLAPRLLGSGRGMASLPIWGAVEQGMALHFHDIQAVGPDLRILARTAPCEGGAP